MATVESPRDVMTLEEVAEFLRVPEATVRQYVLRLSIPGRQIGTDWRFSRRAVEAWLRGRSGKEVLLGQVGAMEDDRQDMQDLRASIYQERGRPEVEET